MVDMLTIAMGRLLPVMDMDMLQLGGYASLSYRYDLLNMDMDRPLPECSP